MNSPREMVLNHLVSLENAGLVNIAQPQPALEYIFRHVLVQEAAYHSLLNADRKKLHQSVGEALERAFPERLEELAPLLGEHFYEAGDVQRAFKYFMQAGDTASRSYANAEAAMHYSRALELSQRIKIEDTQLTHLYTKYGLALELNGLNAQSLETYAEMRKAGQARGNRKMEMEALMNRAKVLATPNPEHDPEQAYIALEQSLALARSLNDRSAEAQVLWNLMILLVYGGGDQRQAVSHGQAALAAARELNLPDRVAFTLNDLTYAYIATDQWEVALSSHQEACRLWRELGNMPMLADTLANSVLIHFHAGRFDLALRAAEEALEVSRSIGNVWGQAGSRVYVGIVYLECGRPDRAIAIMEEALRLGEESGHPAALIGTRTDLAWVYGSLGQIGFGLELARQASEQAVRSGLDQLKIWPTAVSARIRVRQGDETGAEALLREGYAELKPEGLRWFAMIFLPLAEAELALSRKNYQRAHQIVEELISYLRNTHMLAFQPQALYLQGKALLGLDQVEAARTSLLQGQELAVSMGSRFSLWPILASLAEVELNLGNESGAKLFDHQAREVLEYVIAHIDRQELRQTFLELPDVRAVLQTGP